MFPVTKLSELSPRTRQRKIARILQGIEVDAAGGRAPDRAYLSGILQHIGAGMPAAVATAAAALSDALGAPDDAALIRGVNAVRHAMLSALQAEPAEWDLLNVRTGTLDRSAVSTLPMAVDLEEVRSPFNVGSIFRTAEAFGAQRILLSPRTPLPSHPRAVRSSLGAESALPWERAELSAAESLGGVFALELGGTAIDGFIFPRSGVVLVGSEELGLSPDALRLADAQFGRVSIPLGGAKRSLNVSVAFGILMHAWRTAITRAST
jgi:RNA methyltransferase, TrmH family